MGDREWAGERQARSFLGFLELYPSCEFFGILLAGPDVAEEIGGWDFTMIGKEIPITSAAEHQIWIEFTAEFCQSLRMDAWEIRHSRELLAEGGNIITCELLSAGNAILNSLKIISTDAGNEQCGGGAGRSFLAIVFHKIKKLPSFAAYAREKFEIGRGVVGFEIVIA